MLSALALCVFAAPRLVILSWDGAADWVVDRLLAEGKLPNLSRLAKRGVHAEAVTPPFPSKTAVGHYAIFSGSWPAQSDVSNNTAPVMPRAEHAILETRSGFDGSVHQTEPIWVTLAKAGKHVLSLSAAGSDPPDADLVRLGEAKRNYTWLSGFGAGLYGNAVLDPAGLTTIPETGDHTIRIEKTPNGLRLVGESRNGNAIHKSISTRNGWAGPFWVVKDGRKATTWFRLFDYDVKTGHGLLYRWAAS